MNKRAKTLWIPGLLSLAGSMAWRAVLQQTGGMQQSLVNHAGLSPKRYLLWLIALPMFGAMSAYLSRRAGSERMTAVTAVLFPSLVMVPIWLALATRMVNPSPAQWFGLSSGILNWIVLPGVALLLGALPFLASGSLTTSAISETSRLD